MKATYKLSVKKPFTIGFTILNVLGLLLAIGRWLSVFVNDVVVINTEIHSHISNFSLSMIAYLCIGYVWLQLGVKLKWITILGLCMIIANFVCEIFMDFMNTTDIIDAVYGTAGIVVTFIYLAAAKKYGLIPIALSEERKDKNMDVIQYEEQLKMAMINHDCDELDALMSEELIFISHTGQTFSKQDDIESHKSKLFTIKEVNIVDRKVQNFGEYTLVISDTELNVEFPDGMTKDHLIYSRLWKRREQDFVLVFAQASPVS